jgi:outer membrane protein assembly factor BamB
MSAPVPPAAETRPGLARLLLPPVIIVLVEAAIVAGAWLWPDPEFPRLYRSFLSQMSLMATGLVLAAWLMFFSGLPTGRRLTVLFTVLLAGAGLYFSVRKVDRDGDVLPTYRFVWEPDEEQLLARHRAEAPKAAGLDLGDLSGTGPADYPGYLGKGRDGVVTGGPPLVRDSAALKSVAPVWKQPVGLGYSAFAVAGKGLFTQEQRLANEAVVCYDAATGREVWKHEYETRFSEAMGGDGPRATPTVSDGRVYAMGANGRLVCLDARSGELVWGVDTLPKPKSENLTWAMCGSPLVYDDVVVVNPGAQSAELAGRNLVAYDRVTGQEVWHAGDARAGYSSPMLATLASVRQVLILDGAGLAGYDPRGKGELWRFPWLTGNGINVAQPLVFDGDRVFISAGYGMGCALVQVKKDGEKWTADAVWRNRNMRCQFNNAVAYQGHVYGLDEGILTCLSVADGKRRWKGERLGKGQLLVSDGVLVVQAESGQVVLVEATPGAYREIGRVAGVSGNKTWNCPALSDGRVYIRNHLEMACLDLRASGERGALAP